MHFRLDLLFEQDFSALKNFLNMRTQLARLRINDGEFFLDPEGVAVIFHEQIRGKHPPIWQIYTDYLENWRPHLAAGEYVPYNTSLDLSHSPNERRVTAA